ncbi:MAG: carbamoyltransferase C-terminal domain-containing protein, partial [Vicinamibacterales bacterium]
MIILGIWDGHDAGAAVIVDGQVTAAINEERLTRRKLEVAFPGLAIRACLAQAGIQPGDVDIVAASTSDVAKALARVAPSTKESYYQVRRRKVDPGTGSRVRLRAKYLVTEWPPNRASRLASTWALGRTLRAAGLGRATLQLHDHHACHAAAAACTSGFDSALVVTIDGVGDGAAATVSQYDAGTLALLATTPARHSPGVFFEHVTHLLNMRELEDEGKVMALADHAAPVPDTENAMFRLLGADGDRFVTPSAARGLGGPLARILWRYPNEQFAYMAQRALERAAVGVVGHALARTGQRRVALGGGVASNVKLNRRIRLLPGVEDVYVFPHMGDGGLAFGAAALSHLRLGRSPALRLGDLGLGPDYSETDIARALQAGALPHERPHDLAGAVARLLLEDGVVLWFQGRMEFGPRALGHRSMLARPDRPAMRDRLNLLTKRRVWYQPFCPSILEQDARRALADFDGRPNPHMTMAYMVAPAHRPALAGVVNVDGSCRPQMVPDDDTGLFAELLRRMRQATGMGAVLNTSLNLHGSPLVCTPEEAVDVFVASDADA